MCRLTDRYLASSPRAQEHEFLKQPFEELLARTGGVVGLSIAKPQPVRLADSREFPVRLEDSTPVVDWAGLIKSKELVGFKVTS